MTKLILVLLIGLMCEAVGVVFLSKAIKEIGEVKQVSASEIWRLVKAGATNPKMLAGIAFEAAFFGVLLYLMSQADLSFVWPMTALSFVFTTIAAKLILKEQVSSLRWSGVVFIMIGAAMITLSEKMKPKPAAETAPAESRH
jgi:uncharacterized membrane protein